MKHSMDKAPNTDNTPNYTRRRLIAAGAIATVGIGAYGVATMELEKPEHAKKTIQLETLELGEGDNVIDTAINGAREIDPNLSVNDQSEITKLAQIADQKNRVVQPGYEVTVRYGEYDGKPDSEGKYGTDFEVEVTPDVIK